LNRLMLNARPGHLTAFFGTLTASLGTPPAVIDLMFLTFGSAGVTNIGALTAKVVSKR